MSKKEKEIRNVIIIGSGPAGLTAGIYTARANLKPLIIAGVQWGGQLMNTTEVENFPGFPEGIKGPELMNRMLKQAERFGSQFEFDNVEFVDLSGDIKIVKTASKEFLAKSVIVATGAVPKKLEIPGEKEFYGKGVSTCATCDGAFFKEKIVAVVGGGDSAMEEANFLTKYAKKVYLIHRRDTFRASKIMQERVKSNPKIEIVYNTEVKKVLGSKVVEEIEVFNNKSRSTSYIKVNGLFLAIGHIPVTGFLKDSLALNKDGYIVAKNHVETNIDGVFVCGDVEDQEYRQAITAAGFGCMAALKLQRWIESKT
jgi:thioredoxin reductase (NADPH)